jgi:2-succinyl-5-enolpyruvyl-6-hydroxy-3-cyclohexene-1-carboxylate synthase
VSRVAAAVHPDDQGPRDLAWAADPPQGAPDRPSSPWLEEWKRRDAALSARLDDLLDAEPGLAPHHVARAVSAALPPEGMLLVGASNPVRDLDLMVARYPVGERRLVVANRGLAGIDGSVSTAIGAALGRPRTSRAFALLGDVTFLHDSNGLVLGPQESRPDLMIVVANDDGGSIFTGLEQGGPEYASSFERLFGTPHAVDLAALCAASGTPHRRVATRAELQAVIDSPRGGVEVVEAVCRRDNRRELDAAIRSLPTR